MKKTVAILIAVALVFSLAACSGGNGGGGSVLAKKTRFEKLFDEYLADGVFSMDYEITTQDPTTGKDLTMPVLCGFDNGNMYVNTIAEGMDVTIIKNSDGMFVIMPFLNAYMDVTNQQDEETEQMLEDPFSGIEDLGTCTEGKMEIDGTSYDYEEYVQGESACRYLFDGDTLVYIVGAPETDEESIIKVTKISNDVDASLFVIPEGYELFAM